MGFTRTNQPPPRAKKPPAERFWAMVDKSGECWLWRGQMSGVYGRFTPRDPSDERISVAAHRYAYELEHGRRSRYYTMDHLCRRTDCVNPSHLEPVSNAENLRRMHEDRGHRLTCPTSRASRANGGMMA